MKLDPVLLEILACPHCHAALRVDDGGHDELVCTSLRAGLPGARRHPGAAGRRGPDRRWATSSAESSMSPDVFDDASLDDERALRLCRRTGCAAWPSRARRSAVAAEAAERPGAGETCRPSSGRARSSRPARTPRLLAAVLEPWCPVPVVAVAAGRACPAGSARSTWWWSSAPGGGDRGPLSRGDARPSARLLPGHSPAPSRPCSPSTRPAAHGTVLPDASPTTRWPWRSSCSWRCTSSGWARRSTPEAVADALDDGRRAAARRPRHLRQPGQGRSPSCWPTRCRSSGAGRSLRGAGRAAGRRGAAPHVRACRPGGRRRPPATRHSRCPRAGATCSRDPSTTSDRCPARPALSGARRRRRRRRGARERARPAAAPARGKHEGCGCRAVLAAEGPRGGHGTPLASARHRQRTLAASYDRPAGGLTPGRLR